MSNYQLSSNVILTAALNFIFMRSDVAVVKIFECGHILTVLSSTTQYHSLLEKSRNIIAKPLVKISFPRYYTTKNRSPFLFWNCDVIVRRTSTYTNVNYHYISTIILTHFVCFGNSLDRFCARKSLKIFHFAINFACFL